MTPLLSRRLAVVFYAGVVALGLLVSVARAADILPKPEAKIVCVYCGSSDRVDPKYLAAATQIGEELARRGWTLLYGGSKSGLMGAVARGAKSQGGRVVGIIVVGLDQAFDGVDEIVSVATVRERKQQFQARADAFLALPGGVGTLDELSETLALHSLGRLAKPVVLFNQDGYYDELLAFFGHAIRENFARESLHAHYAVAGSVEQIFVLLAAGAGAPPPK